jgi:hypothetical protein
MVLFVSSNIPVCTTTINALAKSGKKGSASQAEQMLAEMEQL